MKITYICKECGKNQKVHSYEEIVKNKKLCYDCISKNNKKAARRLSPKERKKINILI